MTGDGSALGTDGVAGSPSRFGNDDVPPSRESGLPPTPLQRKRAEAAA